MGDMTPPSEKGRTLGKKTKLALGAAAAAITLAGATSVTLRSSSGKNSEPTPPQPAGITLDIGNSASAAEGARHIVIPFIPRNYNAEVPVFDLERFLGTAVETANINGNGKIRFFISPEAQYKVILRPTGANPTQAEQYATEDQATYGYNELYLIGFSSINNVPAGVNLTSGHEIRDNDNTGQSKSLGYFNRAEANFNGKRIRAAVWAPPSDGSLASLINMTNGVAANGTMGAYLAEASVIGARAINSYNDLPADQKARIELIDDTFVPLPKLATR